MTWKVGKAYRIKSGNSFGMLLDTLNGRIRAFIENRGGVFVVTSKNEKGYVSSIKIQGQIFSAEDIDNRLNTIFTSHEVEDFDEVDVPQDEPEAGECSDVGLPIAFVSGVLKLEVKDEESRRAAISILQQVKF